MTSIKRTEISELGEFKLIHHLTKNFPTSDRTIKSIGDDTAVISPLESQVLVTTDFLIEGIHFDLSYTPLKHLGYKAVVVNVSDIYAMNGTPKHITMSIAISNRFSVEALEEFYEGVKLACEKYEVDLIGGDTTSSLKGFVISVTAIGEAPKDKIVYRNGAKVGDSICVTGNLGAAFLGLQILQREKAVFLEDSNMKPMLNEENSYLIQRLLKPEAQRTAIQYLSQNNIIPTSMMDVSDGLSSEILHITSQSNVGAVIEEKNIPIEQTAYNQAMKFNYDPTAIALSGGEDYELLFTIDAKDVPMLQMNDTISIIGEIVSKDQGVKLKTRSGNLYDITAQGWVSF